MKTFNISVTEGDAVKFGLNESNLSFSELVKKISAELSRENLIKCIELSEKYGLSEMTMEEITKEVKSVRIDAKNRH